MPMRERENPATATPVSSEFVYAADKTEIKTITNYSRENRVFYS